MKRTLVAAALAATAASVLMIGGLAAVTPSAWSAPTPGPSARPLLPVALAATRPSPTPDRSSSAFVVPAADANIRPAPLPTPQQASADSVRITPPPTPRPTRAPVARLSPARTAAPVRTSATPTVAAAKAYALSVLGSTQYNCVYQIWMRESGWNPYARNASSGAYGIPQALPGSKMAIDGADWATNPVTQVKWGIGYVRSAYGSACAAWSFWQAHHWY